jgi:hypothetical protein
LNKLNRLNEGGGHGVAEKWNDGFLDKWIVGKKKREDWEMKNESKLYMF